MKASELMIGDWVKYGKEYFRVDGYYRVTNTLFLMYNGHTAHYKDGCVVAEHSKPIPLTEEMLKANGIDKGDLSYEFYDGYNIFLDDGKKTCVQVGPIWFVHELQHALRLCGLNELADNFKVE